MPLRPPFVPRERRSLTGANPRPREDEPTVKVEHPAQAAVVPGSLFKQPPVRSEGFMAFVRAMPCCVCSAPAPSDPHHYGRHGMGQKTDDTRCVPLCRRCHDHFHDHRCFAQPGLDTTETAHLWLIERQVAILVTWCVCLEELARRGRGKLR